METLRQEVAKISVDSPDEIPGIVKLLENPQSILALPGKISLYNHDCLHVLLEQPLIPQGEAFVLGFCMGNDPRTNWIHLQIFKFFSRYIYPEKFRFLAQDEDYFAIGFEYGRHLLLKKINLYDFSQVAHLPVTQIQQLLGIELQKVESLKKRITMRRYHRSRPKNRLSWAENFKWSSSFFGIGGGFLLALNLAISSYGFILLAASSLQLLISSLLKKDKSLIFYSGSIFVCVDLLGIYRWIIK